MTKVPASRTWLGRVNERTRGNDGSGRRIDLRTDIAARATGLVLPSIDAPLRQRLDVMLVETAKKPSSLNAAGERSSQAQNDVSGRARRAGCMFAASA